MKQPVGKATNKYKGYPIVQGDQSNGSVLDTDRPAQAPYGGDGQIGPEKKTNWGTNKKGS